MTNELTELLVLGALAFAAVICLVAVICYIVANMYEHYKLNRHLRKLKQKEGK
jgi:hypothetical protein